MNTSAGDLAVAQVVNELLAAAGVSQKKAAEQTGIPRVTLIRRLQGQTSFQLVELHALADLLGTTAAAIVTSASERAA